MPEKVDPNAEPDPTVHTTHHLKVPKSFREANFTDADYEKFYKQMVRQIGQEMDKVSNKAIQDLKEQRQKIESGEL
jgi:hypothetical protein